MNRRWVAITLYGAAAGLEACWFWAFLDLLNQKAAIGSLSPLFLLGFYPFSFVFHRVLTGLSWKKAIPLSCLAWAALILLLAKTQFSPHTGWEDSQWLLDFGNALGRAVHDFTPEFLAAVGATVFWGFGCRLAYVRIRFATLVGEFQFGLAIFLTLFLLYAQWELGTATLIPLTLAFFFFALGGIAVSHAWERESWLSTHSRYRWFAFLLLSIGFILGFGWLITVTVDPPLVEFLLSLMTQVSEWILEGIKRLFLFLISLFPASKPGETPLPAPQSPMKRADEIPIEIFSESFRQVIRFIWGAMVISLLLAALWSISSQIFEWVRRKMGGMGEAEVEPLPGVFREDLLNFLRKLLRVFGFAWPFGRRAEPLLPGVDWVRKTYRQLSAWAAKKGHARDPAQTPYEYLGGLVAWLPERGGDFTFITEQYVRTRYGLSAPTENGLEELRQSWQRIRQTRLKKGAKKSKT